MVFTESADLASCIQVHITQLYAISINAILAITLDPVHTCICIACTVSDYSSNQAKKNISIPFRPIQTLQMETGQNIGKWQATESAMDYSNHN